MKKLLILLSLINVVNAQEIIIKDDKAIFLKEDGTYKAVPILNSENVTVVVNTNTDSSVSITNIIGGPAWDALQFLTQGSNWMVAPYGIYDSGTKEYGAGICALYNLNPFVATGLRLDYVNGNVWMPSVQFQLQAPLKLFNKVTVVPFLTSGLATPLSGRGNDNLDPVGILGVGMALRVNEKWDIVGDYEKWTSFEGNQYRFGFLYKF